MSDGLSWSGERRLWMEYIEGGEWEGGGGEYCLRSVGNNRVEKSMGWVLSG